MSVQAPAVQAPSRLRDFIVLTKPRITLMVVFTTWVGFLLASPGPLDGARLAQALLGTALAAMGASALNMVLEREADGLMSRTRHRPLPAGRLEPGEAMILGVSASVIGSVILTMINPLTGVLGALTVILYVLAYTPLKSKSSLSTIVGAVPGALPPVMGWTAASGGLAPGAWALFAILFFWQLPHFLAIAWLYRADYARAGYPMLPVSDPDGVSTGRQAVVQSAALLVASLLPVAAGLAGVPYLAVAIILGAGLLALSAGFAAGRTDGRARRLFFASLIYLPLLLGVLASGGRGF